MVRLINRPPAPILEVCDEPLSLITFVALDSHESLPKCDPKCGLLGGLTPSHLLVARRLFETTKQLPKSFTRHDLTPGPRFGRGHPCDSMRPACRRGKNACASSSRSSRASCCARTAARCDSRERSRACSAAILEPRTFQSVTPKPTTATISETTLARLP